jgi:hypothetical protein
MTAQDPIHHKRLQAVQAVTRDEFTRLLGIISDKDPDYVPSEVLVSLIRLQRGKDDGLVDKAGAVLYRRVFERITWLVPRKPLWRRAAKKDSEFVGEASSYFWEKLVEDISKKSAKPSFAESRFRRYLRCHVTAYALQQLRKMDNRAKHLDAMQVGVDQMEGKEGVPFIDTVKDERGDTTATAVEVTDEFLVYVMALPEMERDAVVFRDVYGYDWNETKTLMGCSEPTARGHYKRGKEKAPRSK